MSTFPATYGHRLRQARKAAGWTQGELGRQIGMENDPGATRICRYENGLHMPDGPTAAALSKALRLPQAWFFAETEHIAEAILLLSRLPKGKQAEAVQRLLIGLTSAERSGA